MIEIRICTEKDIEKLVEIGERTFRETFGSENTEGDMEKYCRENFNYRKVQEQVNDKNSRYFFAEEFNRTAGYMKINFFGSQTEDGYENSLEVESIYVIKECKCRGIGKMLMEKAVSVAKENNLKYVWLGVWENNHNAIEFYKRRGFTRFGEHIFVLGDDRQTDYLMKLEV